MVPRYRVARMSRPSRNQDRLLIDTAKRLYPEVGASGMSLKRIADEAGVNLGMFSYYFGTKSGFFRKVLEELADEAGVYDPIPLPANANSIERLRCLLTTIGRTYRDHRRLALAMYRDLLNQDPDVSEHLVRYTQRQVAELVPLIEEGQRDGSLDDTLDVQQIVGFCLATVRTPIVIAASQERELPVDSEPLRQLRESTARLLTDESILQRVELALRGIARPK